MDLCWRMLPACGALRTLYLESFGTFLGCGHWHGSLRRCRAVGAMRHTDSLPGAATHGLAVRPAASLLLLKQLKVTTNELLVVGRIPALQGIQERAAEHLVRS